MVLMTFESFVLASFDPKRPTATTLAEDTDHMKEVINAKIAEHQQISFIEAALIKYFQPSYNKASKDSFPNPAHSTYSECYDIDLNMVSVELHTQELRLRLWSDAVDPSWVHICSFPLHSREERVHMFEFDWIALAEGHTCHKSVTLAVSASNRPKLRLPSSKQ
jgi:hypothetical protein